MATKAKCIAEYRPHFAFLGLVKGQVQAAVDFRIVGKMVDCWWNELTVEGQNSSNGLNGPGCTQQVTSHGFGRADVEFIGMFAKYALDCLRFGNVPQWSRSTVYVDVVNFVGIHLGIGQGHAHHVLCAQTLGVRCSNVV